MNKTNFKTVLLETVFSLVLAAAVYLLLSLTIQHSVVDGSSMLPGLENNQRLIVNKAAYLFSPPQRGEVVIIHPPPYPDEQWVKRIIGMPGDTLRVASGRVFVNDVPLEEPYILESPRYTLRAVTVPADCYFVLGDNRNHSTDSHYGWMVERSAVVGRVWLRFWPFDQWGLIRAYPLEAELSVAAASTADVDITTNSASTP